MSNVSKSLTCQQCGQVFAPTSNNAKRCDACCTFTCTNCGCHFIRHTRKQVRRPFCSPACVNAWQQSADGIAHHRKIRLAERGHGQTMTCPTCGRSFYVNRHRLETSTVRACSNACRDRSAEGRGKPHVFTKFTASPTLLEIAGRAILDGLGVSYSEQYIVNGKFIVDAYLPDHALIVQWDGDFWHANPATYTGPLSVIQSQNVARDRSCNAYLTACGYRVLRFWETDVHARPSWVAAEIARVLAISEST